MGITYCQLCAYWKVGLYKWSEKEGSLYLGPSHDTHRVGPFPQYLQHERVNDSIFYASLWWFSRIIYGYMAMWNCQNKTVYMCTLYIQWPLATRNITQRRKYNLVLCYSERTSACWIYQCVIAKQNKHAYNSILNCLTLHLKSTAWPWYNIYAYYPKCRNMKKLPVISVDIMPQNPNTP